MDLSRQYDCSDIDPALGGMLLSRKGILPPHDGTPSQLRVCGECNDQLRKRSLPKFSIRNGFFIGELVTEVVNMQPTIVERMMTQLVSVVALTRVMRGGAHRCIRSHCMAFDATPGPPATLLPISLDKLSSYRVVVAGSVTAEQAEKIRNLHVVRGSVVQTLLRFYKAHNHFYSSIQMAENGEKADSQIADAVLDFEKVVTTSDVTSVDEDQARVGAENDLEVATGPDDECEMIERSVVFVNEAAPPSKMHPVTELPSHSESSQRRFLVRNSSQFTVDSDGSIYAKMFPHLFPYGRGHPGEERPVPVSVDACIKYYTMHSSRRFAEDETFLLVAFDRLSTQRMFMQISLTCKRHPDLFRGYDTITHEQLSVALHQNELHQQGRLAVDLEGQSPAEPFLRSVEIGTGNLWGSNMERQRCRREAFSYQTMYGQPALFVTLTPNVGNSFAMAQYTGLTSVDSIFDCLETNLPSKVQLRKATMKNDVASARLFARHIDAFIEYVLAVDKKSGKYKTYPGLFGPVKAYYGMVETQGGGTLHAHFIIWLQNGPCNSDEFDSLMTNEESRASLIHSIEAYSSSIVSNTLPLPVEAHCCRACGSTFDNLETIPIPSTAFMDPKKGGNPQAPRLVKCGVCQSQFSPQEVLRSVLQKNRPPVWPPRFGNTSPEHILRRVEVEVCCRYNLAHSIRVVKQREYLHYWCDDMEVYPDADYDSLDLGALLADPIVRLIEMLPPMDDDNRLSPAEFAFMVSTLVILLNEHWWNHTGSCFKTSHATSGSGVCRYSFPRERVPTTQFQREGVQLCRKPAHEYINGFNAVLMATFKSNHDIQILIGGRDVANRIYYCCKYITKLQNQIDSIAAVALAAFQRRQDKEQVALNRALELDPIQTSRKRVAALAYNLTSRQEMAGPLAALYIRRGSCSYSSARWERLQLHNIFDQLLGGGAYTCDLVESNTAGPEGNVSVYRSVTALDDYMHRPPKHENINLYKFAMKFFRRKRTTATSETVLFLRGHPLFDTYCLGAHSRDVVPVIIGPRMPYVNESSSDEVKALRAKIALVLFKPFRSVNDLIQDANPTELDWIRAYMSWETQRTAFDRKIMSNMDDYFLGREKAAEERKWLGTEEDDDADSDGLFDDSDAIRVFENRMFGDDGDYETTSEIDADFEDDSMNDPEETTQLNPARFPSIQEASAYSEIAIKTIVEKRMLLNAASRTAASFRRLNDFRGDVQNAVPQSRYPSVGFLRRWVKDSNTDNKLILEESQDESSVRPTQIIELIRDALTPESMVWNSDSGDSAGPYPTLTAVSKAFTLNPLQHAAFCKIGKALLTRWLRMDPSQASYQGRRFEADLSRDQLLFFLGGAGGTGKSRVIDAVTSFCCGWRRGACVLKTALTGKAATLIQGRTLASFMLSLERAKAADFLGVDMLVIDEVSMLSKPDWLKLDKLLRRYKRVPGVPFGGIHVILVGDFLQLPPVRADPIYIDSRHKLRCSTGDIEVFLLWRRFEFVVVLEESVRFRNDPEWGAGCKAARLGEWSQEFIDLINSRKVSKLGSRDWSAETVFVTPDNVTRTAINNEFVKAAAMHLDPGHYPIRLVANFKHALSGLSRQYVENIMGMPDTRFGRMAPFIDLVEGMSVQVTQNVRPTKGAANGFLEHLEFSSDTRFKLVRDSKAGIVVRVPNKPPLYAMLRIERGPNATSIDHMTDASLFPVFYDAQAYSKSSISLPKTPTGEKRSLSIKLQQLPIVSAVGSTMYKVQGETLQSMVVVEWKSPVGIVNKPQQTYLLVSRVVSRNAFATLNSFTAELAAWSKPPPEALEEENRLLALSKSISNGSAKLKELHDICTIAKKSSPNGEVIGVQK